MNSGVPVVDIAPFLDGTDKLSVAGAVADACERIGFLLVTGNGIDPQVIERAFERSRAFFGQPRDEKDRWRPNGPSQQRGFHALATRGLAYTLGEDAPPDLRETYFLGPIDDHRAHFANLPAAANAYAPNIYPDTPQGTADALITIYHAYERLSEDLLRIFAVALDQPEEYFARFITRHFSILSSHHYPPLREVPRKGQFRTGAHTDFGALTILAMTEGEGGLEVRMPDGAWHSVQPARGELVVNLGDMMARWTNGNWTSTMHRVANPRDLNSARSRRQSIGYFMHPDFDCPISAVPSCVPAGEEPRFRTISAGEHIAMKIAASHEGAAVARDTRRAQPI